MPVAKAATKKKRVDGAKRRELIVDAARQAFLAYGYSGARTRDIADRAGVTEALLYRHFASKQELFEEAIVAPLEQWTASAAGYVALTIGALDEERREIARAANAELLRATVEIMPLLGVVLFCSPEDGRDFYMERFMPFIERSVKETAAYGKGWMRPDVDPGILCRCGIGLYMLYAMEAHFRGAIADIERIATQFVDIIFDGIAPPTKVKPPSRTTSRRRS